MDFKGMVAKDLRRVFLDTGTFAERRTIRYDGEEYTDIPIVLEGPVHERRTRLTDDHVQGLFLVTATLYCALEDIGGHVPEQGQRLDISSKEGGTFFRRYYVQSATCDMGMLHIELEVTAQ